MQLALGVADDIGYTPTDRDRDHPDELLGSINDDPQVNVHQRVAAHLDVAGSAPSPLHEAIAKLQAAGRRVAVVTTNFDRHLSTALAALGPDEFLAPALPMGDDFEGLVYLHGSLIQPCERLVVTDTDFGAAYLRDGWAARFLERMFRRYTVLFVGYSHNDVVMSYLARSLGRDGRRYALTEPGTDKRWARLGIMPVTYPNPDRKHAAASATIDAWATWLSMGMLEHRARVAKVVSTPPPLTPPDDSYLASIVADDEKVALFTEHARGAEWLSWASSQRPFVDLFNQDATPTCSGGILADWFAQHFVMDKALTDRAFSVVLTAGGRLGPQLAYSIGRSLGSATAPRPTWLNRWLLLLIAQAPPQAMWLGQALVRSQIPADIDVALLLFDRLSEPHAAYRPAYGESVPPSIDTRPIGEPYWLRQTWADVFGPHLELVAPLVIPVVNRHLRRAHQLVAAHSGKQRPFDMASFSRPAIEGHAQNEPRRPLDPLIDAARDCLQALLDTGHSAATYYLDAWAESHAPLLRRLAVHGWAHRSDVDATAKINWLRGRGWLFESDVHYEVYRLIELTSAEADPTVVSVLVADAAAGPSTGKYRDAAAFRAVAWIARHAPELPAAIEALEAMQAAHPELSEVAMPDFRASWQFVEQEAPAPPITPEALHDKLVTDLQAAVEQLQEYVGETDSPDRPSRWPGAKASLLDVIHEHPIDGLALLHAGADTAIAETVVEGWTRRNLEPDEATRIATELLPLDLTPIALPLAAMLSDSTTAWHEISAARELATATWNALPPQRGWTLEPDGWTWTAIAINHPAGELAQFWIEALLHAWRQADDRWNGLPEALRNDLERLLASDDDRTKMAQVILAGRLHILHAADPAWATGTILPLLGWEDPDRARLAWDGYLHWGQANDALLGAGLLDQYAATAEHYDEFPDELQHQLAGHLASVALFSVNADIITTRWLHRLAKAPVPLRISWTIRVTEGLKDLSVDAIEHQWQGWMRPYWQDRLASKPARLDPGEAAAIAAWPFYLDSSAADGVPSRPPNRPASPNTPASSPT